MLTQQAQLWVMVTPVPKERLKENKQSLKHEENLDSITTGQGDAQSVATGTVMD